MAKKMTVKVALRKIVEWSELHVKAPAINEKLADLGASDKVIKKAWEIYDYRCESEYDRQSIEQAELARCGFDETGMPIKW